ncbi:hypothetical protein JW905_18375 [bacterium]|nr:hypothetical protein [candidate division CSSED10-310 bacterium]
MHRYLHNPLLVSPAQSCYDELRRQLDELLRQGAMDDPFMLSGGTDEMVKAFTG